MGCKYETLDLWTNERAHENAAAAAAATTHFVSPAPRAITMPSRSSVGVDCVVSRNAKRSHAAAALLACCTPRLGAERVAHCRVSDSKSMSKPA